MTVYGWKILRYPKGINLMCSIVDLWIGPEQEDIWSNLHANVYRFTVLLEEEDRSLSALWVQVYLIGAMPDDRLFCSCSGIGRHEKCRDHQKPPTENEPVPPYCSVFLSIRSISGHRTAVLSSLIRASIGSNL